MAVTNALSAPLLVAAYSQGIFPWTSRPVAWFSPDPRAIFPDAKVRAPSKLPRLYRRSGLTITCDTAFSETMRACRHAHLDDGAWIDESWVPVYSELWEAGLAHSVEVWRTGELVGGIYGVHIGGFFAGESMFHRVRDASKFALCVLSAQLLAVGVRLFDVQVLSDHTEQLGARNVARSWYLAELERALALPVAAKRWPRQPLAWGALSPPADGVRPRPATS